MDLRWKCCAFHELAVSELYSILRLRNEVFVVEQRIRFNDTDGKDPLSLHLFAYSAAEDEAIVAYARIFPPGVVYSGAAIGRVCSDLKQRRKGYGIALMQRAMSEIYSRFGEGQLIELGAQLYLKSFYESLGFTHDGSAVYKDGDDIDHIHMTK